MNMGQKWRDLRKKNIGEVIAGGKRKRGVRKNPRSLACTVGQMDSGVPVSGTGNEGYRPGGGLRGGGGRDVWRPMSSVWS